MSVQKNKTKPKTDVYIQCHNCKNINMFDYTVVPCILYYGSTSISQKKKKKKTLKSPIALKYVKKLR